jgi:hypothetical protein
LLLEALSQAGFDFRDVQGNSLSPIQLVEPDLEFLSKVFEFSPPEFLLLIQ